MPGRNYAIKTDDQFFKKQKTREGLKVVHQPTKLGCRLAHKKMFFNTFTFPFTFPFV